MKVVVRRVIAVAGALLIPYVALRWGFIGAEYAERIFHHVHDVASRIGADAIYDSFSDPYVFLGLMGLLVAAGLSFALFMWDARPTQNRNKIIFALFLAAVLPVAILNYWQGDIFVSRSKQAFVDLVLVFLGSVTTINLAQLRFTSIPARVLQAMVLFFIAFQAVFIPSIFAILWWLNWQRAISLAQTRGFGPGWISLASGIASLVLSVLQYRRSDPARQTPKPQIIAGQQHN